MPEIVTYDQFIEWEQHEGSSELPRKQVEEALKGGRRDTGGYVGKAVITEIEGDSYAPTAENQDRDDAIKLAVKFFTLRILLPTLNKFRNGGIPVREQDGTADGANVFESFSKDTVTRMDVLKQMALEQINVYLMPAVEEEIEPPKPAHSKVVAVQFNW